MASPDAFGASIGRGLEQVGQGAGQIADAALAGQARADRQHGFEAQTNLLGLENQWNLEQQNRAQNVQPGADGFHKTFISDFDAAANKYFEGVPDRLKPIMREKLVALRGQFELSTSGFEAAERTRYHTELIGDGMNVAADRLASDPKSWRRADDDIIAQIRASGISPVEQDKLIRQWQKRRAVTEAAIQAKTDPTFGERIAPELAGQGVVQPEAVVAHFEGYVPTPFLDTGRVRRWRTGYSSDTITRADGSVETVTKDTVITRADADRDLARRSRLQANLSAAQVGVVAWDRLDDATHAALISVGYNYGELPSSVVQAVRRGDKEGIAVAVEGLSDNKDRRKQEAAIIRSGVGPDGTHGVAPEFQVLPAETRLTLYDQWVTDKAQAEATARAEQSRLAASTKGTYELQIAIDPTHVDTRAILADPTLNDGTKAELVKSQQSALGISNETRAGVLAYNNGTLTLNPMLSSDRSLGDKVFDAHMKGVTDPAEGKAFAAEFIDKTHIVPSSVAADIRNRLASNVPGQLATALVDATNLYGRAKTAVDNMDGGTSIRDQVAEFRQLVDGRGMSSDQAAQTVLARRGIEWKADAEALKAAGDALVKTLSVSEITSALNPPGWTGAPAEASPAAAAEMLADYQDIAREKLITARGDPAIAKAQAQAELLTLWNVSTATGNRVVMKFPPEHYYPPVDGSYDYMAASVAAAVKAEAGGAKTGLIEVQSYKDTTDDIHAGHPPRYLLHYQEIRDGQPIWHTVLNGAWQLSPAEVGAAQKMATDNQSAKFAAAKKNVEDLRKATAGPPGMSPMNSPDVNPSPFFGGGGGGPAPAPAPAPALKPAPAPAPALKPAEQRPSNTADNPAYPANDIRGTFRKVGKFWFGQ